MKTEKKKKERQKAGMKKTSSTKGATAKYLRK